MPGVMTDQHKALADTTELTGMVYFFHYRDSNSQPLGQQAETMYFGTTLNWIRKNKRAESLPIP